ncbi:MAG: hypothetical protein WCP06_05435 [Verrucomicrobiota bacterium]
MGDPLGEDERLAAKDNLYRVLDLLLPHKQALFEHPTQRWRDLFGVKFNPNSEIAVCCGCGALSPPGWRVERKQEARGSGPHRRPD